MQGGDSEPHETDPELETQMILLASSHHDLETLRTLLRKGSANVQDSETGYTPLHSAIAACERSEEEAPNTATNGNSTVIASQNGESVHGSTNGLVSDTGDRSDVQRAAKTVRLLLQNGAIWNDLDNNDETPGCLARRLGLTELYEIMVDAGVRAEMLLNRLDAYELLRDEDESEDDEADEVTENAAAAEDSQPKTDDLASSLQSTNPDVSSAAFLQSNLSFQQDRLLDDDKNGVMMAWETQIMERTADLLLPKEGLRVLNVGHGMGIIDTFFQSKSPASHHIIEAHSFVLEQMKTNSWMEKSGVTIHKGKWQEIVPKLIEDGVQFDAIYFDTFAEDYKALRDFFDEYVIGLLDDGGKWGFFHGLGADRQICYDVYTKVVEMDIFEAGYDVEWESLPVPDLEQSGEWHGVRRRYWVLDEYKLPICTFIS
ncbi:MAG: Arginine N-methyltransferase 2 [Icmadophila ericetorum]|nr:Arginine N-methyltransferase 2 [Icmadophila ericetorum]